MLSYLNQVAFNEQGLVPAIAVDAKPNKLLMQAWASREALATAVAAKRAVYWSRAQGKHWYKGEGSENVQRLVGVRPDGEPNCYRNEQIGGIACNTDRAHCFYQRPENDAWGTTYRVLVEPEQLNKT